MSDEKYPEDGRSEHLIHTQIDIEKTIESRQGNQNPPALWDQHVGGDLRSRQD